MNYESMSNSNYINIHVIVIKKIIHSVKILKKKFSFSLHRLLITR